MTANVFAFAAAAAARDPGRPFITTQDGRVLTYGALVEGAGRYANALAALGVAPGDRVAVQVEKSPEGILLYLGCLRAGAVYLPLNTAYTLAELSYFIGDAEPSLIVCDPASREALAGAAQGAAVETLDANGAGSLADKAAAAPTAFADVARTADDLAAICYTSGTTGRSKGAMLHHGALSSNAVALRDAWRFTAADELLHALPIYHIHGLFISINTMIAAGAGMVWLPKFEPNAVIAALPRATAMMGVPTFYTRLLQDPRLNADLTRHIRVFISGSAPLLAETHREWRERTGHALLERYGMTETGILTSNPYDGDRIAGTVGKPLPGLSLRIADPETGAVLPQGEIGMIEVKGSGVFKGYWRMPEKTAAEFRADGYFITGDLGLIDARGYVQIVGRGKDLVISGGFNVYPKEVEVEIDALPGVVESAVIGLPHPDFGEGVTAVIAARPGATLSEAEVIAALADRLARFKQPKRVLFVDDLPRNAMGKVQKAALRERWKDLYRC